MAPIPRLKPYDGPAVLSYGFRPFFLLGSIWAGIEVLAWLPMFYGELSLATAFSPRDWHVHELLFAVVVAFNKPATKLWGRTTHLADTDERCCGTYKMFHPDGRRTSRRARVT